MKQTLFLLLILNGLIISCTDSQTKDISAQLADTTAIAIPPTITSQADTIPTFSSMIDPRDGEVYTTVKIWKQHWMAENLRYDTVGAMINPDNPSPAYGRLYKLIPAQSACPPGWHLPSDEEWDQLEIAHGMPVSFVGKGGWRGQHAIQLKSTSGWGEEKKGNGTNSLGFNILPAGYYFSGDLGGEAGVQGLGYSAAFWSARNQNVGYARFLFDVRNFVNKWADTDNDSEAALSCRCVED